MREIALTILVVVPWGTLAILLARILRRRILAARVRSR
jgi:hypothetical protein